MHNSARVKQSAQYQALEKHLAGELAQDDALVAVCKDIETKARETPKPEDLEEPLWQAWRAVVTMAASVAHPSESRQKLVDFVLAVQSRPAPAKECTIQEGHLWVDLPIFGMEMREAWNLAPGDNSSAEQQRRWVNLNAWTATLVTAVQDKGQSTPDFSLYGIWTIRMALEEKIPSHTAIEAAAVWFIYATPSIHQMSLESKTFDGKVAKPGALCKDRDWRGFCQSRWADWTRQMKELQKSEDSDEVSGLVAEALEATRAADGASCARR